MVSAPHYPPQTTANPNSSNSRAILEPIIVMLPDHGPGICPCWEQCGGLEAFIARDKSYTDREHDPESDGTMAQSCELRLTCDVASKSIASPYLNIMVRGSKGCVTLLNADVHDGGQAVHVSSSSGFSHVDKPGAPQDSFTLAVVAFARKIRFGDDFMNTATLSSQGLASDAFKGLASRLNLDSSGIVGDNFFGSMKT